MEGQNDFHINWNEFKDLNKEKIEETAQNILSKMTLKQKLNQLSGDNPLLLGLLADGIRYNKEPYPTGGEPELGIPPIQFTDGPRGIVLNESTCFPVSMARGATWDIELEEKVGNIIGIEGRSLGGNYYGGVCINLLRHPSWGRAQETYGEDSYHLGEMGAALTRGVQRHMMACAKHYACNSMENARFKVNVKISERTLREIYLRHFKRCVDEGVASIMSAYNKVNGKFCGHNRHLLRKILKEDWKFDGFVVSDFLLGVRNGAAAVNAGLDIEMPYGWRMRPKKLYREIYNGNIPLEYIDDSVLRILRKKIQFHDIGNPNLYRQDQVACKEHIALALEVAQKSMVLLKNERDYLPLDKDEIKKIAVIGELADTPNIGDKGSSRVYPPYVITPYQGIKSLLNDSAEVICNDGRKQEEVIQVVKGVDVVVIVAGFTHKEEGEFVFSKGGDRDSLTLKEKDERLILSISQINKNCIVVLQGGSAIMMENWNKKVPAIIMSWYSGMEGGNALADIIFGNVNPCAKLPFVIPKSEKDLPYFDKSAKSIEYGYYHGYRLLDKESKEPAFPFGFGLSYTNFEYSNLKVEDEEISPKDKLRVSVTVKNTGNMDGEEIVQLYIGYNGSKVDRPAKDLKGFAKILVKKGESKNVEFELDPRDLAYYDEEKSRWVIERIGYSIYVGGSSKKTELLKKEITMK
ncbi:MAG: glycosyl hydrolase [Candidatus Lokiarchaeota archaeon]|nr:glycosyl hydrolase [Candidatus Lokiarchaeota archaeon]